MKEKLKAFLYMTLFYYSVFKEPIRRTIKRYLQNEISGPSDHIACFTLFALEKITKLNDAYEVFKRLVRLRTKTVIAKPLIAVNKLNLVFKKKVKKSVT